MLSFVWTSCSCRTSKATTEVDVALFFLQAEDGIRDHCVTGVQTCALPICERLPEEEETLARYQPRGPFECGMQSAEFAPIHAGVCWSGIRHFALQTQHSEILLRMKTYTPLLHHSITPAPAVRLVATPKSWIEGEAVRQLYATAKLPGVHCAVGFPDLHPGKRTPVGAAFLTADVIYPH